MRHFLCSASRFNPGGTMASVKTTKQSKAGNNKKKAIARQNAARRSGGRTPIQMNQANHGRFPDETPLTGEDRPAESAGGKKQRHEQPVAGFQPGDGKRFSKEQPLAARQQS